MRAIFDHAANSPRVALHPAACSIAVLLAACATPATEVHVDTMSMHDALDRSRAAARLPLPGRSPAPPPRPSSQAPQPILSAPDIRLAYLYEWIDAEGNKHFGSWVAIPVSGYDWVMLDGSSPPIKGPGGAAAAAHKP